MAEWAFLTAKTKNAEVSTTNETAADTKDPKSSG